MDITKSFSIKQYINFDNLTNPINYKVDTIKNDMIKQNPVLIDLLIILLAFFGVLYSNQATSIMTCQQSKFVHHNRLYQYMFTFGAFYFIVLLANRSEVDFPPIQKLFNCIIYFIIFLILNRLNYIIMILVILLLLFLYFIYKNKEYYYKLNIDSKCNCKCNCKSKCNCKCKPKCNCNCNKSNINFESNSNSKSNTNANFESNAKAVAVNLLSVSENTLNQEASIIADHQYWITWDYPRIRLFPVEPYQNYYISLLNKIIIILLIILVIIGFINYIGILKYTYKNKFSWYNVFIKEANCEPLDYSLAFMDYILLVINYNYYIKKVKPIY